MEIYRIMQSSTAPQSNHPPLRRFAKKGRGRNDISQQKRPCFCLTAAVAVSTLQTLVVALGAELVVWGVINLILAEAVIVFYCSVSTFSTACAVFSTTCA